jgi:hypothetical protein
MIGFAGILVTVATIMYVNYELERRGVLDEQRVWIARKNMIGLIKEIEFYETNTSQYPEALTDLKINNPTIYLLDPMQQVISKDSNRNFFYKKEGSRYYFFSQGFDGIEFTQDDLYPARSGLNLTTIGIIMPSVNDSLP